MKSKYLLIIAFIVVAIAQLYVPASIITSREKVITLGKIHKFKTRPIDPTDPFRGKYVSLNFDNIFFNDKQGWVYKEIAFVTFTEDYLGFTIIDKAFKEAPNFTNDYLEVEVASYNNESGYIRIKYPFNRFYMEESKAPEAEKLYIESNRNDKLEAYAKVYIKDGVAVLNDVIIDEIPLKDWVVKE